MLEPFLAAGVKLTVFSVQICRASLICSSTQQALQAYCGLSWSTYPPRRSSLHHSGMYTASCVRCCLFVCPVSCVVRTWCARPPKVLSRLTGGSCKHMDQRGLLRTLAQRKEGGTRSIVLAVQTAIHCAQPVIRATAQFSHGQHRHLDKDQQEPQ